MKESEGSSPTATNTSQIKHHHKKHSSVFSQKSFAGFLTKNTQNTNNSILDVSRDLRIGQETTFHNQNDYTPNSPTSQISALTRYEQNTTQGAPIINPKRMQIIRKKKTVSIGAGIEPNSRDIEQNISENLQDKPQLQKSPTNDEIDSLTKNFINSADFVSQQLEFRCERTLLEAKWVLVSSYIMMIFPICMIVYQLFLLITIQKQVQLIQENTNDDEGNPIDIKLSYPLFIVSILFTLFSNILIFSIGLFGRKVFPQNIKAIQILVQNNFEQLKLEQRYQIYTKKFFNYTVILIIAIGLLTTCQIGINFINIEKAQSEYVKQHRLSHVLSDNFLSKNEIKTINTLKQGYEFSYLGIAAFELIFFLLFLCNLIKFKANQLKLENQTITFNYMLKGQSYFEEVEENPEQNQNSFQLQANEIKFFNKQENNTSPHKNNVYQNVQQQSNPNTTQISNRNINTTQINQQSQNGPNLNPQNPLAIQILNQTKQNSSSFTKLQKKVLGSLSSHNRNQQAQNIQRTKKVDKSKQEYSYQSQDDQEIDLDFYESQNSNSKREQNIDDLNYAAQGIKFISKNQNKSKQDTQEQQYIKRKNYYLQNSSNYNSQNQD
eukprot:403350862